MKIVWLINQNSQGYIDCEAFCNSNQNTIITSQAEYLKVKAREFVGFDALVVQVNLDWLGTPNSTYDGIQLVQELRGTSRVSIPIIFLSFALSREEILKSFPALDIISTFGLSNGFCFKKGANIKYALPVDIGDDVCVTSINDYIKLLPKIDVARRYDNKYFCCKTQQIRRFRHDITYNGIGLTKNKLKSFFKDDTRIDNAKTIEELSQLCDTLEREVQVNEDRPIVPPSRIKVLLLDDKYEVDKGIQSFLAYSGKMLDIKCCKMVKEALATVVSFNPNVVLVDLRFQDDTEYPIINKQQGYDYLSIHKEFYPHIGLIVLSRLPMAFLRDLSRSMSYFRTFHWKKMLEGTTYCEILMQSIIELATIRFLNDTPQKEKFKGLYNWWYGIETGKAMSDTLVPDSLIACTYDQWIDDKAKKIIDSILNDGLFTRNAADRFCLSNPNLKNLKIQRNWIRDATLADLFVFRRVAAFLYYYLYKNANAENLIGEAFVEVRNDHRTSSSKSNTALERYTVEIMNRILANNWCTGINPVTNRHLFFKAKKGRIQSYKDISLTKEEKEFFARYYTEFFNAWNKS